MGTGQQLLTIAGIFLLGILILNVHRSNSIRSSIMYSNEAIVGATSVGQSVIDEILVKAFDEETIGKEIDEINNLTSTALLGPETGEGIFTNFDDIDDYNGYTKSDSVGKLGVFNVNVDVYYVKRMDPDVKSAVRTFAKRIDIFVTNFSLKQDTVKLHHVVAY